MRNSAICVPSVAVGAIMIYRHTLILFLSCLSVLAISSRLHHNFQLLSASKPAVFLPTWKMNLSHLSHTFELKDLHLLPGPKSWTHPWPQTCLFSLSVVSLIFKSAYWNLWNTTIINLMLTLPLLQTHAIFYSCNCPCYVLPVSLFS